MQTTVTQTDALIIGAGIAGLMAAQQLTAAGIETLVVDKGRSVGGRLATRRIGKGMADHGAQFFTVREPEFQALVDEWIAAGVVFEYARGWLDGSLAHTRDGHPRYACKNGMNALARHVAQGINTRVNIRVSSIQLGADGWQVLTTEGVLLRARGLVVTPPVPQTLDLLDDGGVRLTADQRAALESITYEPCIAAMIVLDGELRLPAPGAIQRPHAPIYWIADNQRKGISPDELIITAQASHDYSKQLWDRTDEEIAGALRVDLMPILGEAAAIREIQIKRWRYSQPLSTYPERALVAAGLPPLVFAGDAFGDARVEGAVLSGMAAGKALVGLLKE